jgi:Ribosomal protein L16/L10E
MQQINIDECCLQKPMLQKENMIRSVLLRNHYTTRICLQNYIKIRVYPNVIIENQPLEDRQQNEDSFSTQLHNWQY